MYDWLAKLNAKKDTVFSDQSVQRVLWDLECSLERVLVAPRVPDYDVRLRAAQLRVRDSTD